MASHTGRAFLSLGRINAAAFGLQKPVNRVTYATALPVKSSTGNKGEFDCRYKTIDANSESVLHDKLATSNAVAKATQGAS